MPYRAKPIFNYSAYNSKGVSASSLIKLGITDLTRKFKIDQINQSKFDAIRPYLLNIVDNNPDNFVVLTKSSGIPYEIRLKSRISMVEITDYKTNLFLTESEAEIIIKSNIMDSLIRDYKTIKPNNTTFFPNDIRFNWNEDNFGPIVIPSRNQTIKLTETNLPIYKKAIRDYEKNTLSLDKNGNIRINNILTDEYTFKQDYYWMMGDNRYRSEDSRSWGFVPQDHIVGKPVFIWFSIDGINDGFKNWKIRWDRVFTTVNLDGEPKSYRWYFIIGLFGVLIYSEIKKRKKK